MSDAENVLPQLVPPRRVRRVVSPDMKRIKRVARDRRLKRRLGIYPTIIPNETGTGFELASIGQATAIDLKKRFPISRRQLVKEMFPWLMGFTALIWLYWHNFSSAALVFSADPTPIDEIVLYGSAFGILSAMTLYHLLQRIFFQYKIEGFRLIIRKGILLVEEGSLPLLPIAEVFARRGLLDLIFGLYQVHVAVPVDLVKSFARIEGLSKRNAALLIDYLSAQLSRQVSMPEHQGQMADFNGHHQ